MTGAPFLPPHTTPLVEVGFRKLFAGISLKSHKIFLISVSQVTRITALSYHAQAWGGILLTAS
jgi:hypothetical protein